MFRTDLYKRHGKALIFTVFFASGFCGLIYEVIWVRILGLVLGNSIYAVTLVVAAFMAGMGLGSFAAGKYSENKPNPLRIYAFLELGIGLFALISPLILNILSPVYVWIGHNLTSSPLFLNAYRLILAFVVLLVPTVMMGATLPVLSKFLVTKQSRLGNDIAALYGINTLGATAGCLITGFVLIELIGVRATIFIGAIINFVIAAIVFSISAKFRIENKINVQSEISKPAIKEAGDRPYSQKIVACVLIAFAFSGLAAIAYEVVWTRALSFFVGHTTYAFTTMLGTLLFGIGLGSLLIAKRSDKIKSLITILAVIEILIGLSGIIGVPIIAKAFYGMEHAFGRRTWATPIWVKFIYSFIIMLVPALLMGMTFPLVSKIYVNMKRLGTRLGAIYALNTIGGIVGSFLAAFLFIPWLGVHKGIVAIAFINIVIGAALIIITPEIRSERKIQLLIFAGILLAGAVITLPFNSHTYSITNRVNWGKPIYYKEGLTNVIEILQRDDGSRDLFIDGELNASTSRAGILIHRMLAEVPLLLHPNPKSIFIVGLGSGMSAGAALPFESVTNIGCAEISTDIIDAADNFSNWNHDILESNRFHLQIEDGRIVLLTDPRKYDVMVTGIIHPKYNPGNAGLYSKDYYELCKSRLNDDGIMCQWIPLNALREGEFKMIIRTFQDVFPHTSLWFEELFGGSGNYNAVLIGSRHALQIDFSRLASRFQNSGIADDMRTIGINSPVDFLNHFMLGEKELAAYVGKQPIITDNRPRLEFGIVDIKDFPAILGDIGEKKELVWPYLTDLPQTPDSLTAIQQDLNKLGEMTKICIAGDCDHIRGDLAGTLSYYREAARIAPDNDAVNKELSFLENRQQSLVNRNPDKSPARAPSMNNDDMIKQFEQKVHSEPSRADYRFELASSYQQAGKYELAIEQYQKVVELDPTYLQAKNNLGIAYMQTRQFDKSEALFLEIIKDHPDYIQGMANLAQTYAQTGRRELAIQTLEKALTLAPNDKMLNGFLAQLKKSQ